MADPNKFKSVSVPIKTYQMLNFLAKGVITPAELTISKTIEVLATKESKKNGYKNGTKG
jgi:hypothetical protein